MKARAAVAAAFFCASVLLTTAVSLSATPPVEINDLVGRWRSDKDKKTIITIVREGNELKLQTPKYSDWEPLKVDATTKTARIHFERKTTPDDIRKMSLDNPADGPPPESVVEAAAGSETEGFNGWPKRTSHYFKKECDLTMRVQWQGFHIKWNKDTGTIDDRTRPKPVSEDFTQIHYAWPDLRKTVVSTQYTGSSNTGTEINSYFTERPAMEVYGEFGVALFKPIFSAITDVVPAETLLGKIAQKLFEKIVEKSLQGDLKLRDLAEAVAGQVLGKALEGVADREPFASIRTKLEDVYTEDLVKAAGGSVTGKAAEKLTAAEKDALAKYLAEQCRYDLITLKPYGVVLGGISVVDRQTGNATVWLFLKQRGSEPRVVIGSTTVPEEGEHKAIGIAFSPIQ
jgi:hypothetical protein